MSLPQGVRVLRSGRFQAIAQRGKTTYCLGTHDTPELASAAVATFREANPPGKGGRPRVWRPIGAVVGPCGRCGQTDSQKSKDSRRPARLVVAGFDDPVCVSCRDTLRREKQVPEEVATAAAACLAYDQADRILRAMSRSHPLYTASRAEVDRLRRAAEKAVGDKLVGVADTIWQVDSGGELVRRFKVKANGNRTRREMIQDGTTG